MAENNTALEGAFSFAGEEEGQIRILHYDQFGFAPKISSLSQSSNRNWLPRQSRKRISLPFRLKKPIEQAVSTTSSNFASPPDCGLMTPNLQATAPGSQGRRQFEKLSPEKRAALETDFERNMQKKFLNHLTDVGVHSKEGLSENQVLLRVGSSISTNTMDLKLERTVEGWKLQEPF